MPGYAWSESESNELRVAVRVHGLRWAQIVRTGRLPGRTALSMRLQWKRLSPAQAEPAPCPGVLLVWGVSWCRCTIVTPLSYHEAGGLTPPAAAAFAALCRSHTS